jgi:nucleotide-binding universal stress UspA family protein
MTPQKISSETKFPHLLFKNVLVPIDGSQNSKRALQIAVAIAKKYDAQLFVVHVVSTPMLLAPSPSPYIIIGKYLDFEDEEARKIVNEGVLLAKRHGVKVTGHVIKHGPSVVEAITGFAVKRRVDLIVTGTRGLGGFKKLLLGSVASGMVSHAHCKVLVVR